MKYGILAKTRPGSMWGAMTSWCVDRDSKPLQFDARAQAQEAADGLNARQGPVSCFQQYFASPMEQEQADAPQQGMRML